ETVEQTAGFIQVQIAAIEQDFITLRPFRGDLRRAKIEAAVTAVVNTRFYLQMEVLEVGAFGIEVAGLFSGPGEDAVLHAPVFRLTGRDFPARRVLAIEQRHERILFWRGLNRQRHLSRRLNRSGRRRQFRCELSYFDASKLGDRLRIVLLQGDVTDGGKPIPVRVISRRRAIDFDNDMRSLSNNIHGKPIARTDRRLENFHHRSQAAGVEATCFEWVQMRAVDLGLIPEQPLRGLRRNLGSKRSAKTNPAIAAMIDTSLGKQMKILVVRALRVKVARRTPGTDEDSVLDPPVARLTWMRHPAGLVLAVEKRDESFPDFRRIVL